MCLKFLVHQMRSVVCIVPHNIMTLTSVLQILQTNTFQAVLVTDGTNSFAIFIYRCGDLEWGSGATIGFGAGFELFLNHRLSISGDATSIACINTPDNQFFTVLYNISNFGEGKICVTKINVHLYIKYMHIA